MDIVTYNKNCYDNDGNIKPGKIPLLHNMGKVLEERSYYWIFKEKNIKFPIKENMTYEDIEKKGGVIVTLTPKMDSTGTVYEDSEDIMDPDDSLFLLEEAYIELMFVKNFTDNKIRNNNIKKMEKKIKNYFINKKIPIPPYYKWR